MARGVCGLLQQILGVLLRGVHVKGRLEEGRTHGLQMGAGGPEPAGQTAGGRGGHEVAEGQRLLEEGADLFWGVQTAEAL